MKKWRNLGFYLTSLSKLNLKTPKPKPFDLESCLWICYAKVHERWFTNGFRTQNALGERIVTQQLHMKPHLFWGRAVGGWCLKPLKTSRWFRMVHQIHLAADASQDHAILSNKIVGTENALNFATYPGTESKMLFWLKGFKFNWAVIFFVLWPLYNTIHIKPHKNYVLVPWRMRAVSEFQETQLALLVPLVACKPKLLVIVQCHGCLLMAPHKGNNQCLKASQLLRQIWVANGEWWFGMRLANRRSDFA